MGDGLYNVVQQIALPMGDGLYNVVQQIALPMGDGLYNVVQQVTFSMGDGLYNRSSPFSNFFSMDHGRCTGDKTPWVMGP